MVVREIGVRQCRKVFTAPLRHTPACLRQLSSLSSETSATPVAATDPIIEGALQTSPDTSNIPSIFQKAAKPIRRRPVEPDTTKSDWEAAQQLRKNHLKVGTIVKHTYSPSDVFRNPPGPKDVTLELLMASQAHMGHNTSVWNPANARYIYGVRQGIHIISLEETAAHLRRAARVVEDIAYRGGLILFVGTRPGQTQIVTQAARLAGACHLFTKWKPGTITNSDVILQGMPMKMLDHNDEKLPGFDPHLLERRPLVPDLVVCLNPMENSPMLRECGLANVPTIGVIDTNADPTWVTYAIPANDDSLRCLAVLGSVLGRAGQAGQKRRLKDAQQGIVKWQTPEDVKRWISKNNRQTRWTQRANDDARLERKSRERGSQQEALEAVLDEDDEEDQELAKLLRLAANDDA